MDSQLLDQQILWGISVLRIAVAVGLLALGFFGRRTVRWGVRKVLAGQSDAKAWADDAQELLPRPLSYIVWVVLWYAAGLILTLPRAPLNWHGWVMNALTVVLAVAVTYLVFQVIDVFSRAAERAASKTHTRLDDQLVPLLRKTLKIVLGTLAGVSIVDKLGYSASSLIAGLSIGGLALALAAKDTIANIFGSVVVFADRPFQVGDSVAIGSIEGTVEEVGIRTTRIRGLGGSLYTIPNQNLTNTAIQNLSSRNTRRILFDIGLTYDATPQQIESLRDDIVVWLQGLPEIVSGSVLVRFTQLADSSLNVQIRATTGTTPFAEFMALQEFVLLGSMRLVENHGLEFAFPTRSIVIEKTGES